MTVRRINIVAHTHYDVGYTDHPAVTETMQCRALDRALDLMLRTEDFPEGARFHWTQEVTWGLRDWWERSSPERRSALIRCAQKGQYEVCAFPFSSTPCMDRTQWAFALKWLPEEISRHFPFSVGMQTDVNGLPLAAVREAVKQGVRRFWMGPNSYLGSAPFSLPCLFRWRIGEGETVTVWVNNSYGNFHSMLGYGDWRIGPIPEAADLLYHAPAEQEIFAATEANLRRCHAALTKLLKEQEETLGRFPELPVSCTNQYRYDNDPPPEGLSEFIREWNRLGLEPRLELTVPSLAMERAEQACPEIPVYSGEWTDWWARGSVSMPREMAASRRAKRILSLFQEGKIGELPEDLRSRSLESLCFFNEHSWDSWDSAARPWSEMSQGTAALKSNRAFLPAAELDLAFADAVRKRISPAAGTMILFNPSGESLSEFVTFPAHVLRGTPHSVLDRRTGRKTALEYFPGWNHFQVPQNRSECSVWNRSRIHGDLVADHACGFWSGTLAPGEIREFELLADDTPPVSRDERKTLWNLECDSKGWPVCARFEGIGFPIFTKGTGDFVSKRITGDFPRDCYRRMFGEKDRKKRLAMIRESVLLRKSVCRKAERIEHDGIFEIRQYFSHPALFSGCRKLEFWNGEPRVRLTVTLDRKPDFTPEVFSLHLALGGMKNVLPEISTGGEVYHPGTEQIPGSCMDYYAIDGCVLYSDGANRLALYQADNALLSFCKPYFCEKVGALPQNTHDVWPLLFDNTWDTNFPPDSNGLMSFRFELFAGQDFPLADALRRGEAMTAGVAKIK